MKKLIEEIKNSSSLVVFAYALIVSAVILAFWFILFGGFLEGEISQPDPDKAKIIQPFITGLVVPLLTLGSTLLVIANLRSINIQNFSNNFFKLIDQHHRLVSNIDSQIEGFHVASKGTAFFDDIAMRIAWDFENLNSPSSETEVNHNESIDQEKTDHSFKVDSELAVRVQGKIGKERLIEIYDHYFHLHHSDLSHYFRNLFHIVKFVERSSVSQKDKFEYVRMLRAQLSNYELVLIAYDGLHDYGKEFYPLIEKYELIKSLNDENRLPDHYEKRIVDIGILTTGYPKQAKYWAKKAADGLADNTKQNK